jgi:hypothetical protein
MMSKVDKNDDRGTARESTEEPLKTALLRAHAMVFETELLRVLMVPSSCVWVAVREHPHAVSRCCGMGEYKIVLTIKR